MLVWLLVDFAELLVLLESRPSSSTTVSEGVFGLRDLAPRARSLALLISLILGRCLGLAGSEFLGCSSLRDWCFVILWLLGRGGSGGPASPVGLGGRGGTYEEELVIVLLLGWGDLILLGVATGGLAEVDPSSLRVEAMDDSLSALFFNTDASTASWKE